MWDDLLAELEVDDEPYPGWDFVPKPDAATLEECERVLGVVLPRSYVEFAMLFGAGELAGLFRIAAPLSIEHDYNLPRFNSDLHGPPGLHLLDPYGPADEISQFLFFCSTGGGEFYGWKTSELADPENHEYVIYEFPRQPTVRRISNSFEQFVRGTILTAHDDWEPEMEFRPFSVRQS